jgi:hypothetical protein
MDEVAVIAGGVAGRKMTVSSLPAFVLRAAGLVQPRMKDLAAMVDWFATGSYVANTQRQAELFGAVPKAEEAIARFAGRLGHGAAASAGKGRAPGTA